MKRKILGFILIVVSILMIGTVGNAKNGDVVGYAKYTDIAAYINHYPITSYNINGYTAVVAEDLRNYGFDVKWNAYERSLKIVRNTLAKSITPYGNVYNNSSKIGQNASPYLETDIKTYINGKLVESFNIDGRTIIYFEDLKPYGEVIWVPEIRAIKMWIDGLPTIEYKALVEETAAPIKQEQVTSTNTTMQKQTFEQVYNTGMYGTVSGTLTYKYNDFRGHIGDTGSHVILIPTDVDTRDFDNRAAVMGISGTYESGIRVAQADGNGNYVFNNVPVGNYYIIAVSNNTTSSMYFESKEYVTNSLRQLGSKYFSASEVDTFLTFTAMYKYSSQKITVTHNYNYIFSHDFGITYI